MRNVFLYWTDVHPRRGNSPTNNLIKILRRIIYHHSRDGANYKVHLITPDNISEYLDDLPPCFYELIPAQQADFVRTHVIYKYGGIYLDSDTLVMHDLSDLFEILEKRDGFLIKTLQHPNTNKWTFDDGNNKLCNGVFGSRPNTTLLFEWTKEQETILEKKGRKIVWGEIGGLPLREIFNEKLHDFHIFKGPDNLYPIYWPHCYLEFIKKPYENYKNIERKFQPLIILVNRVYQRLTHLSEKEILESNYPLNYFINKSLGHD